MTYILKRLRGLAYYANLARAFGLGFLISLRRGKNRNSAFLFSKPIRYTDRFWFLHGIQEIFVDEVYLFRSDSESPYIIDCGSNIGLSLIYYKQIFPNSRIMAFEPDPGNYRILLENISSFGFKNIEVLNAAVWSEDSILKFNSFGNVGSKLVHGNSIQEGLIDVKAVSLPSLLSRHVDFLKVDIEGAELEVLLACQKELQNVKNVFVEYHSSPSEPQKLNELLAILSNAGFRYYIRQAWEQFKYPYVERKTRMFDLQLNIFGYRD